MYGTGIGTGTAGGAMLFAGMTIGSWFLLAFAIVFLTIVVFTLLRNHGRRAAHQRP